MKKEIVIDVQLSEIAIALLQDERVVEFTREESKNSCLVGNVYVGTVRKIMPGLNAAFVDIGGEKEAFLHVLDLGSNFHIINAFLNQVLDNRKKVPSLSALKALDLTPVDKNANIADVLKNGQRVLVQVIKEPISTKGARVTCEISLAGRNLVMIPYFNKITVSQKIESKEERLRLRRLVQSIKVDDSGIIIRTVAEGKKVAALDKELKVLTKRWETAIQNIQKLQGNGLVLEEVNRIETILRDVLSPDFENIYVNNENVYNEICDYVTLIAPDCRGAVKLYDGELPIFDHFAITKQIKSLFGRTVSFKRGAYLIIEKTEAMTVIDVNSGNRSRSSEGQEENALAVNLAAAEEIAHQIRLRDIGGIIVIDFIDLMVAENRQLLLDRMVELMQDDRARHNILPLSKFCLMQITRHRVRPAISVDVEETCPTCFGKGKAMPSILFTDQLEEKIEYWSQEKKERKLVIQVHPYIAAYINQGFFSLRRKWSFRYKVNIKIQPIQSLGFLQYQILNKKKEVLKIDE